MLKRVQHDRLFGLLYRSSEKTQSSLLNAHCSLLTTQKRLEDGNMNSRGLLSPRYFNVRILVASVKLRLSESRAKLAWAMPSVSNLDEVKDAERQPSPHVRVFQTPFLCLVNYSTGLKTRGYSPSASRLPDAFFLSHDHQSRLEDGKMNSRWAFKPPDWSQTRHIMASGRRGVK